MLPKGVDVTALFRKWVSEGNHQKASMMVALLADEFPGFEEYAKSHKLKDFQFKTFEWSHRSRDRNDWTLEKLSETEARKLVAKELRFSYFIQDELHCYLCRLGSDLECDEMSSEQKEEYFRRYLESEHIEELWSTLGAQENDYLSIEEHPLNLRDLKFLLES